MVAGLVDRIYGGVFEWQRVWTADWFALGSKFSRRRRGASADTDLRVGFRPDFVWLEPEVGAGVSDL